MDTNTTGKFKPKPPPKPSFDGKLPFRTDQGKLLSPNKKLNITSVQKFQLSGTLPRDQKPPLLPKPQCLSRPKLSLDNSENVAASTSSIIPSPVLSPASDKKLQHNNASDNSHSKLSGEDKSQIFGQMKIEDNTLSLKSLSSVLQYSIESPSSSTSDLTQSLKNVNVETNSVVENQSVIYNEVNMSSCDNIVSEETGFFNEVISDVNISKVLNVVSVLQSNVCNDQIDVNNESDKVTDNVSHTNCEDCDNNINSSQIESTSHKSDLECVESDLKTLSYIDQTPSNDVDSQSSDSSCGSFTVISNCLHEDESDISYLGNNDTSDVRNQSFLHSLNCLTKSCEKQNYEKLEQNQEKKAFSENQFSIENVVTSVIETSTPVATGNCNISIQNNKSDHVNLRKKVLSDDNFSSNSWTEDDVSRDKSNSIDNDSIDGSVSVRRRLSSWFGSFGKGNKQKEKRESSLFYCDQTDLVDVDTDTSSNIDKISQVAVENSEDQYLSVPLNSNINFDPDNNRSSVSEESGEVDQQTVSNTDELPEDRKRRKAFFVARELMTSEKVFIDVLKLLCFDFKNFIKNYSKDIKSSVIPDDEFDKIIASLPQLLRLSEDLVQDLESRINSWSELPKISDVIVKKGPFLKLFSVYIQNFESQCNFLDECCHKYPRFSKALKCFEVSERCKKLSVKHYMLKPVQRIPQYRLLLDDYLGHLDEGSLDYEDTLVALNIVSDVANHANKSIKNGDHLCKLLHLQSQLGNYEIIRPWRRFIKEGELCKLSRKENQLRYFILLNDCLLYTSFYGSMTGLRVKYELPLSGMKVTVPQVEDCNSEFSIITSTRSFTLRARSLDECNEWVSALQNAIKENNNRQLTFVNMKFIAKNAAAETIKLGKEAPIWIQDKRVTMCQACTAVFTVTFRRHHCRACGKVVCGSCSENKAPLQYMKFQTARVCDECHNFLLKEFEDPASNMYEIIKSELCLNDYDAITNAIEHIRSSFKKQTNSIKKMRKYIPSRLKEVTANDTGSQMSGWLFRKSKRSWKRLWFVLKEQVLYVYKASEDVVAVESIPILGYKIESVKEGTYDDTDLQHIFQLSHVNQDPLVFGTDSHNSANRWIAAFEEAIVLK